MQLTLKLALATLFYGVAYAAIVSLHFPGVSETPNIALTASKLGVDSAGHTTWVIVPAKSASSTFGVDTAHPTEAVTVVEDASEIVFSSTVAFPQTIGGLVLSLPTDAPQTLVVGEDCKLAAGGSQAVCAGSVVSPATATGLSVASFTLPAVVVPVQVDDAALSGAPRRIAAGVFGVVAGVVAGALML
ncbi:uncharacterized protein BXZ73DRAFT_105920 [Epithele typhae]|uniref:uncharacterized protein n=1 Tax=Epithele typhae TaxID=378194 RepID=UPI0020074AF2|nr:uncharacterized protein BXZ73DRAFT_105920 [Epithele typhae]KAH9916293.1 hypothetical protein BXZ73DRAFT_105920 [Epithele typhae]